MDISLLKVNKTTKEIVISSAKRPAILIRDKVMQEFKGNKFSLGGMRTGEKVFEESKINFKKDLIIGSGGVTFTGVDPKSKDQLEIIAETMRANPQNQLTRFKGNVHGYMQRKKKYEGKMTFSSQYLQLDGIKSLAHLEGVTKRVTFV